MLPYQGKNRENYIPKSICTEHLWENTQIRHISYGHVRYFIKENITLILTLQQCEKI
jgi:hypothetical protein